MHTDALYYALPQYCLVAPSTVGDGPHPFDADHAIFDNQAGVSIIKDLGLLDGVYPLERAVIVGGIDSSSAPLTARQGGHLPGFGPVLYVPGAACNVIAQATCASRKYHVSMDYPHGEDGHAV